MNKLFSYVKLSFVAFPVMGALLVSGCLKEEDTGNIRQPGDPILFGFPQKGDTGAEENVETRTEYSGWLQTTTTPHYERIDWKNTDQFRVLCMQAPDGPTADYQVQTMEASGKYSEATSVTPMSGYGLHWGTNDHYFYAMYPVPGMKSNYPPSSPWTASNATLADYGANQAKLTGKIPAIQEVYFVSNSTSGNSFDEYKPNMNYAYMSAAEVVSASSTSPSVELHFKPLVTAFEFTFTTLAGDAIDSSKKLTKVELQSGNAQLAGTFETVLSSDNTHSTPTAQSDWSNKVTLNLGEGITLSATPVKFTLFTLPVEQSELTLILTFGNNEFKRTLELKNNGGWVTVGACKKLYVSNVGVPNTTLEYELAHTGTTITLTDAASTEVQEVVLNSTDAGDTGVAAFESYKTYKNHSGATVNTPVSIKTTYEYAAANADGSPVVNGSNEIVWNSGLPSELNEVTITAGSGSSRTFKASVKANASPVLSDFRVYDVIEHARNLKNKSYMNTTQATAKDLSYYDCDDLDTKRALQTTANCYVVDRPGYYKFPMAFGNAITNGTTNTSAFKDDTFSSNQPTYWSQFQCHAVTVLINGWNILDNFSIRNISDVNAVVVWEDVESSTYSFIDNLSVGMEGTTPYVYFEVPEGSIDETTAGLTPSQRVTGIRQGNAVIALRYQDGDILWSWHIWVTDGLDTTGDHKGDGLKAIPVKSRTSTNYPTNNLMNMNLGWCEENVYQPYLDRVWYVRITQSEPDGTAKKLAFKVVQKTPEDKLMAFGSSGTYYQWGRKDPLIPGAGYGNDNTNKACYSPIGFTLLSGTAVNNSTSPTANASASVKNPHILYVLEGGIRSWMSGYYPLNLWNTNVPAGATAIDAQGHIDYGITKTVYDPCPPGYSMPQNLAFTNFASAGPECSDLSKFNVKDVTGDGIITAADFQKYGGWHVYTDDTKTNTIFLPATGYREDYGDYRGKINGAASCYLWLPSLAYWSGQVGAQDGRVACLRTSASEMSPMAHYNVLSFGFAVRPMHE